MTELIIIGCTAAWLIGLLVLTLVIEARPRPKS